MAKRTDALLLGQAIEQYRSGDTVPVVAKATGVAESVLYRALKANGIQPTKLMRRGERGHANRRFTDETEAVMAAEYQDGASLSGLANQYGVNLVTIRNCLVRQGVERRPRGKAPRTTPRPPAKGKAFGERHGNWKGGAIAYGDYRGVLVPFDSPFVSMRNTNGYVLEHRLVMAQELGRPLAPTETVHHINGISHDNRPENLQLRSGQHGSHEAWQCLDCGSANIAAVPLKDTPYD